MIIMDTIYLNQNTKISYADWDKRLKYGKADSDLYYIPR